MPSFSRRAGGSIKVCRFVKITSVGGNGQVLQAVSNSEIYGISQQGTNAVPGTIGIDAGVAASDAVAAATGQNVTIYGQPEKDVLLKLSAAQTCVEGDRLMSDADGAGLVTTTAGTEVGAIAMETQSVAGALVKVMLVSPQRF